MPKISKIWSHFEKRDGHDPKCLICLKPVKATGNTTNLFKHLNSNHKEAAAQLRATEDQPDHTKIDDFINEINSFKEGDLSNNVDSKIAWWTIWNSQPYRVVEQKGFKEMVKSLNKNYNPPSRTKLKEIIHALFEAKSNQLKTYLNTIKWVSVTSDGWKDISNQIAYVCVTLHFIDNYQLFSVCIKADQYEGEATADNIKVTILSACEDYGIVPSQICSITTDGGANFKKAASEISEHIHCVAHKLNLIVQNALETEDNIQELIGKVRAIVTSFKKSTKMMDDLTSERIKGGEIPYKLMQDIVTRWNSSYLMLERYLTLRDEISVILLKNGKRDLDITDYDVSCLREIVVALQPFYEVTLDVSGENYVTISRIIPLVSSLRTILERMRPDTGPAIKLVQDLQNQVQRRFGLIEKCQIFAFATLLDPRFKKIDFTSTSHCSLMVSELNGLLSDVELTQRTPTLVSQKGIWEIHDQKVHTFSDPTAGLHVGLKHYLETDVIDRHADPIKFWKENKNNWPQLHHLAIKYLTSQATSVASERVFSKTGAIITEKRNRLKPKHVNELTFLSSLPESLI